MRSHTLVPYVRNILNAELKSSELTNILNIELCWYYLIHHGFLQDVCETLDNSINKKWKTTDRNCMSKFQKLKILSNKWLNQTLSPQVPSTTHARTTMTCSTCAAPCIWYNASSSPACRSSAAGGPAAEQLRTTTSWTATRRKRYGVPIRHHHRRRRRPWFSRWRLRCRQDRCRKLQRKSRTPKTIITKVCAEL